jgi:hypothetical protein
LELHDFGRYCCCCGNGDAAAMVRAVWETSL